MEGSKVSGQREARTDILVKTDNSSERTARYVRILSPPKRRPRYSGIVTIWTCTHFMGSHGQSEHNSSSLGRIQRELGVTSPISSQPGQPRTELKQPCTVLNCNYTPINYLCRLSLNDSCVRVCVHVYGVNTLLRNFQGVCWYRRVPAEPALTSRQA